MSTAQEIVSALGIEGGEIIYSMMEHEEKTKYHSFMVICVEVDNEVHQIYGNLQKYFCIDELDKFGNIGLIPKDLREEYNNKVLDVKSLKPRQKFPLDSPICKKINGSYVFDNDNLDSGDRCPDFLKDYLIEKKERLGIVSGKVLREQYGCGVEDVEIVGFQDYLQKYFKTPEQRQKLLDEGFVARRGKEKDSHGYCYKDWRTSVMCNNNIFVIAHKSDTSEERK